MSHALRFLAPLALLLPNLAGALDLTPTTSARDLEGFKIPVITFADGARQITYQPPGDWRYTGDAGTFTLVPRQQADASMQLRVLPRRATAATTAENLAQWTQKFLPADAVDVTFQGTNASPFTLEGRPSAEFTYAYRAAGRRFVTAVAVCDLNEQERLAVIITARTGDFKAVREDGMASLFSWNWRD